MKKLTLFILSLVFISELGFSTASGIDGKSITNPLVNGLDFGNKIVGRIKKNHTAESLNEGSYNDAIASYSRWVLGLKHSVEADLKVSPNNNDLKDLSTYYGAIIGVLESSYKDSLLKSVLDGINDEISNYKPEEEPIVIPYVGEFKKIELDQTIFF